MDVLSDVLEAIHIKTTVLGRLELTAPWGLQKDGGRCTFLVVTRGACWLEVADVAVPFQLAGGDLVLLTGGQGYILRDGPQTRPVPFAEACHARAGTRPACQPGGIFHYGGGGPLTTIIGGCFDLEDTEPIRLISALPPVIHVRGDGATSVQWLEASLQFVASEMASGQPGAQTVVSRLADILFVQAIRAYLAERGSDARGWLRGLLDPQIGHALGVMHQRPEAPWTVQSLADTVGMSRSAFASRFAELVEAPPLAYLTRWRMHRASRLLGEGRSGLSDVASRVGYDAEAAFSKAFKRWMGIAPGAYRRGKSIAAPPAS